MFDSTSNNVHSIPYLIHILERWDVFACCGAFPVFYQCISTLLPLIQISLGFLNCFPLFILILIYFPAHEPVEDRMVSSGKHRKIASYLFVSTCLSLVHHLSISVCFVNVLLLPMIGFILLWHYGSQSKVRVHYVLIFVATDRLCIWNWSDIFCGISIALGSSDMENVSSEGKRVVLAHCGWIFIKNILQYNSLPHGIHLSIGSWIS